MSATVAFTDRVIQQPATTPVTLPDIARAARGIAQPLAAATVRVIGPVELTLRPMVVFATLFRRKDRLMWLAPSAHGDTLATQRL